MVHADESLMAEDDRAAGAGGGAQLPLEVAEHPEFSAERPEKRLRANNPKDMLLGLKNLERRELHVGQMWNWLSRVRGVEVRLSGHIDARAGSF